MSEPVIKKRKVLIAVLLSFLMPGMGHIYCGRIVKGITALFLMYALIPAILISLFGVYFSLGWLIVDIFVGLLLGLFLIVDSGYIAKCKTEGYVLKDYNKWYVYLILYIFVISSTIYGDLWIRERYFEKFIISTASNYPTMIPGDRFVANKAAYKTNDPKRGDMVVYINPADRKEVFIHRVIAVAFDTVEMKDNQLFVNGRQITRQELPQSTLDNIKIKDPLGKYIEGNVFYEFNGAKYKILLAKPFPNQAIHDFAPIIVPQNHCFVLGDNRDYARDSRYFGTIPIATIKGRAEWLYWPAKDWSRFDRLNR